MSEVAPEIRNIESTPWKRGDPTPHLNAALAKAQGEFEGAAMDSVGQVGGGTDKTTGAERAGRKYKYADLSSGVQATRAALSRHGIAFTQDVEATDAKVKVTTTLLHASGEERSSKGLPLPVDASTAQRFGSATTYAKRYDLFAMLGIIGEDDDDDGASASRGPSDAEIAAAAKAKADRAAGIQKMVAAFAGIEVDAAALDKMAGGPVAEISNDTWTRLRQGFERLKKAYEKPVDPDEAVRRQVAEQSEKALGNKSINFANCIDRIRAATTEAEVVLVEAEFVGLKPTPTKGDIAAMARASKDRRLVIAEVKRSSPPKSTEDIPF